MEKDKRKEVHARGKLLRAMAVLGQEKPFSDISVTELCRKAEINRVTFYRNYEKKEDLVREMEDLLIDDLEELSQKLPSVSISDDEKCRDGCSAYLNTIIVYYLEHKEEIVFLLAQQTKASFDQRLREMIAGEYERMLKTSGIHIPYPPRALAEFIAGGSVSILQEWLKKGNIPDDCVLDMSVELWLMYPLKYLRRSSVKTP